MPHKNIWIRKSDLEAWESIQDKPRFLHDALAKYSQPSRGTIFAGRNIEEAKRKALRAETAAAAIFGITTCKHGYAPELCKYAKVKNGKKTCK